MTIERGPDERVSNNSASNPATSSYRNYRFPNVVIPPSSIQAQRRHLTSNREQQQPRREHEILMPVKPVYKLTCGHCSSVVCARGMKAILLADTAVELYSTDVPSQSIRVLEKDYLTRSCHCRIRDIACLECGNILGYHVVSPCSPCLDSSNNGHFWMFHSSACQSRQRQDRQQRTLMWSSLPKADRDIEFILGSKIPYEQLCR